MSNFKVGDTVRLTEDRFTFHQGDWFEVVEELAGTDWIVAGSVQYGYAADEWVAHYFELVESGEQVAEEPVRNKYMREISPGVWIDVYDVLYAFKVTDPCLQHLIKKALAAGQRGHKDERQDLVDIRDSAQRALDSYDKWLDSES